MKINIDNDDSKRQNHSKEITKRDLKIGSDMHAPGDLVTSLLLAP